MSARRDNWLSFANWVSLGGRETGLVATSLWAQPLTECSSEARLVRGPKARRCAASGSR